MRNGKPEKLTDEEMKRQQLEKIKKEKTRQKTENQTVKK